MLNVILTLIALGSAPAHAKSDKPLPPIVVQAPSHAGPEFRVLAVPAGATPSPEYAVPGMESGDEVEIELPSVFAKAGWKCGVSKERRGASSVQRSVVCLLTQDKVKRAMVASATQCPLAGEMQNYTTLNLGVGNNKMEAGVTFLLLCKSSGEDSKSSTQPELK